ncbi:hypothetical protein CSKR_102682 [Clonorchis sinensis]|uniref:Uncharacterized protein n=1 Tax=Clonorchis sinensis TaxID=79923 RepID=A0A419PQ17_CLOSI|nr:hypothetical protein CSKR_102682 [Clonorchis sinensis]
MRNAPPQQSTICLLTRWPLVACDKRYTSERKKAFAEELFIREAPTYQSQTIGQGSKTLICISLTKLNFHFLLERDFPNFSRYPLTVTQMQANATKRPHKFLNRSHFSREAMRIYEKIYYSHASSAVSTVTLVRIKRVLHPVQRVLFTITIHETHQL